MFGTKSSKLQDWLPRYTDSWSEVSDDDGDDDDDDGQTWSHKSVRCSLSSSLRVCETARLYKLLTDKCTDCINKIYFHYLDLYLHVFHKVTDYYLWPEYFAQSYISSYTTSCPYCSTFQVVKYVKSTPRLGLWRSAESGPAELWDLAALSTCTLFANAPAMSESLQERLFGCSHTSERDDYSSGVFFFLFFFQHSTFQIEIQ